MNGELVLVAENDEDILASWLRVSDARDTTLRQQQTARALDIVRERRPRIVVLDIGMPELDGLEVLATIRAA
jgi:CheY-like chemotaxis protein